MFLHFIKYNQSSLHTKLSDYLLNIQMIIMSSHIISCVEYKLSDNLKDSQTIYCKISLIVKVFLGVWSG